MKSRRFTLFTIAALLLMVGALSTATVFAGPAVRSTSDVLFFDPQGGEGNAGDTVDGASSTLVRTDSGISNSVHTSALLPGAYTNWWIIFNEPAGCVGGCGLDDVENRRGDPAVIFATGNIVSDNGIGNFGASLSVGDDVGALFGVLKDSMAAEVHYIIRYHGPIQPGIVDEMIHTVGGGCSTFNQPDGCYDPQVSIHLP